MALYVNTNVSSLNAQRKMSNVTLSLSDNYSKLASGQRINSSSDDASGFQIQDRLTGQINGLNQGNRNANDGIAFLQTVDGAAGEILNNLQRIRTLAIQSANGTNSSADRKALTEEASAELIAAMANATDTTFAGAKILMGYYKTDDNCMYGDSGIGGNVEHRPGKFDLQVGANSGDVIPATIENFFIADIAYRIKPNGGRPTIEDLSAGSLTVIEDRGTVLGMTIDISTPEKAQGAIQAMDYLIAEIDRRRGTIGSYMTRLESSIRNQSNVAENESDARARIRDTDFASETASFTQNQIIQRAAETVLSQANQRPSVAASLLK